MVPRTLELHPSTLKRLIRLSKEAEQDGSYRVAKRLQAVVMNAEGYSSGEIARILKAPRSKASEWLRAYEERGVEGLLEGHRSGRPSGLNEKQLRKLGEILDCGPAAYGLDTGIWTSPMISWVIQQEFGIEYHPGLAPHVEVVSESRVVEKPLANPSKGGFQVSRSRRT